MSAATCLLDGNLGFGELWEPAEGVCLALGLDHFLGSGFSARCALMGLRVDALHTRCAKPSFTEQGMASAQTR